MVRAFLDRLLPLTKVEKQMLRFDERELLRPVIHDGPLLVPAPTEVPAVEGFERHSCSEPLIEDEEHAETREEGGKIYQTVRKTVRYVYLLYWLSVLVQLVAAFTTFGFRA